MAGERLAGASSNGRMPGTEEASPGWPPGVEKDGMRYERLGAYFMAQTRIKWLLSAPRHVSDERGLVGGVGEAGEVGGLGVAH